MTIEQQKKWNVLVETMKDVQPTKECGNCTQKKCTGFRCEHVKKVWADWSKNTNAFYRAQYEFNVKMGELFEKVKKDIEEIKADKEERKKQHEAYHKMLFGIKDEIDYENFGG